MTTVFLDCETLGLDRMAPIWEFAAIRIEDDGSESARMHFQIWHDPMAHRVDWLATLPESFVRDYQQRYGREGIVLSRRDAAFRVAEIVDGRPIIAGSNPSFDMERLGDLLAVYDIEPGWHYHPHDIPSMASGWLAARGLLIPRPWKSDALSSAVGINPSAFDRHTAMGDVEWTLDLYTAMVGTSNLVGGVW